MASVTPERASDLEIADSTRNNYSGQGDGFQQMKKESSCDESSDIAQDTVRVTSWQRSSFKQVYNTVAEITVEPSNSEEPDVKDFFRVLRNHRLQSKLVYVLTVVAIVAISHFVLTVKWILPYFYTITTPILLVLRLILYWKMKYQYFLLDFCYFANTYWYIYLWLAPQHELMFVVGYAVANGPLIWALLVFRNSLVFHSLDKVTSLYIHLLPTLLSFVIRWYPEETSEHWYKPFPRYEVGYSFFWLVLIPFVFVLAHQVLYIVLVNCILRPNDEYLTMYRYLTAKESSFIFRMCNIFGPRFRIQLYVAWGLSLVLIMLLFNPVWYNFFIPHCVVVSVSIIIAIYNGATYYLDVFSIERMSRHRNGNHESASSGANIAYNNTQERVLYGALVNSDLKDGVQDANKSSN
ncbi:glycerophosphocholine acyltransferase 1 [Biomphalaria pfeifferi]|uniref:Glycerophosphocholine acyltransferase 1 n=1 Tax=Biomphalaria pfeifferi TaxID=112525 RepID=A0AAD8FM59_BIOPF|nr:glycerophosphocholine acyltransferase 1 [Biomphalaria pfeifferi]